MPDPHALLTRPLPDLLAEAGAVRDAAAGCHEALFTLGERPELRYDVARARLREHGFGSTVEYLAATAQLVLDETGLLPHANAGRPRLRRAGAPPAGRTEPGDDARVAQPRPCLSPRRARQGPGPPPRHA